MAGWVLGVIGGSGLYRIEGLEDGRWERIASPWGVPSDQVYRGRIGRWSWFSCRAMGGGIRLVRPS